MPPSQPSCSEQSDYQRAVGRVVSPLTRRFGAAALGHPGSRWERGAPSGLPCASAQWPFQRLAASSPRKEGGYLGFLCVWGGTPPTSLHEEGASFQACAAMPQIPKPACFRCTVPVTLWMEPFRPLASVIGKPKNVQNFPQFRFAQINSRVCVYPTDFSCPPCFDKGLAKTRQLGTCH